MKVSKELMKQANIFPKLRLGVKKDGGGVAPTGPHTVKMVSDKIVKGVDSETGKPIEYVRYVVTEDGIEKEYRTRLKHKETGELNYLVQNLSQVEEGDTVILEMKKRGIKNYVEVRNEDGSPITDTEQEDVVETDEDNEQPPD
jgi:hypothetical protein